MKDKHSENRYWTNRYQNENTGWDIGYPSTPLKNYFDQLEDKTLKILIPGAGNAYEAEYLFKQGFRSIHVLDISTLPLENLKKRSPNFPEEQLLSGDFFEHQGQYDLVLEQTFFCSFLPTPENRKTYAKKMHQLLKPGGKLVGLWFNHPLVADGNRPFGGDRNEYLSYLEAYFETKTFTLCINSIPPRAGNELFGIFTKIG